MCIEMCVSVWNSLGYAMELACFFYIIYLFFCFFEPVWIENDECEQRIFFRNRKIPMVN